MEQDIQKEQENKYIPKRKTYYFVSKSRLFFCLSYIPILYIRSISTNGHIINKLNISYIQLWWCKCYRDNPWCLKIKETIININNLIELIQQLTDNKRISKTWWCCSNIHRSNNRIESIDRYTNKYIAKEISSLNKLIEFSSSNLELYVIAP